MWLSLENYAVFPWMRIILYQTNDHFWISSWTVIKERLLILVTLTEIIIQLNKAFFYQKLVYFHAFSPLLLPSLMERIRIWICCSWMLALPILGWGSAREQDTKGDFAFEAQHGLSHSNSYLHGKDIWCWWSQLGSQSIKEIREVNANCKIWCSVNPCCRGYFRL